MNKRTGIIKHISLSCSYLGSRGYKQNKQKNDEHPGQTAPESTSSQNADSEMKVPGL